MCICTILVKLTLPIPALPDGNETSCHVLENTAIADITTETGYSSLAASRCPISSFSL
jgi:hypothetical protein